MTYSKFLNLSNHIFQEEFKVTAHLLPLPESQDLSSEESPHPSSHISVVRAVLLPRGGLLCVPQHSAEIHAAQVSVCMVPGAELAGMWGKPPHCSCTGSRRKGAARNDHKVG